MKGAEVGICLRLPIRTRSPNRSFTLSVGGRMAQASRAKKHKELAALALGAHLRARGLSGADFVPVRVRLIRVSAGVLDDDNLVASLKATRDGIAKALGIDDGDRARLRFAYGQRKGPKGAYEVECLIERGAA